MDQSLTFVLAVVGIALVFDFINGFHDSANSIATVVATRVLSPRVAVAWAASFNFLAAFVLGRVEGRVGQGILPNAGDDVLSFSDIDKLTLLRGRRRNSSHKNLSVFQVVRREIMKKSKL
jgi:PiT family inorganic phosphate transporter